MFVEGLRRSWTNLISKRQVRSETVRKVAPYLLLVVSSSFLLYFVSEESMEKRKLAIEKWDEEKDGKLNEGNMERKLKKQGYTFMEYTFCPGTTFPDHTHSVSKKDAIVRGRFQFTMYDQTVVMEPGDMIEVPKNTVHNAKVVGSDNVVFYDSTK